MVSSSNPNLKLLLSNFKVLFKPVSIMVGVRLGLGIMAFFAYILYPQAQDQPFANPNPNTSDASVLHNRLLTIWSNWDGNWYLQIAQQGYHANPDSQAFFPLYPLLIRVVGKLLFDQYLLAGILISTIMVVVILVVFYEMVKRDHDDQLAEQAMLYLIIFPTAFYFFAVYTEALFLALVLGSFFAARYQRRWWLSGILGALASLTRNVGVFIAVPLFIEWLVYRYGLVKKEIGPDEKILSFKTFQKIFHSTVFATGLPIVAFIGWLIFSQVFFNSAFRVVTSQSSYGRELTLPWITILESLRVIFTPGSNGSLAIKIDWYQGSNLLNLSFFAFGLTMLLYGSWKFVRGQFPLSYLIFLGIGLFLPLISPAIFTPLESYPRYMLPLFPIFILWAQVCRDRKWLHFGTLYLCLSLLGLLFSLFANGFWVT